MAPRWGKGGSVESLPRPSSIGDPVPEMGPRTEKWDPLRRGNVRAVRRYLQCRRHVARLPRRDLAQGLL
jgi:hypothetical protein